MLFMPKPEPKSTSKNERKKSTISSRFLEKRTQKTIFNLTYEELYNIVAGIFVIALIFAYEPVNPGATFEALPRAFFAVAVAFLLPLAAQKMLAKRLNCGAFYRLWLPGLIVSMLLMVVGIRPILLVGAVSLSAYQFGRFGYKSRHMTMTEIGWIGAVGPITNILLVFLFKALASGSVESSLFSYMAMVSGLVVLFNLAPIKPLDGSKIVLWNPLFWVFLVLVLMLILTPSGLLNYFTALYNRMNLG